MTIGIYKLSFTGTDKVYIGQCRRSIENRFTEHCRYLRNNAHSLKMNSAYAEFGLPTMEILTECSIEELNSFENETIEIYNSVANGFNSLHKAEDIPSSIMPGEDNPNSKYPNALIIKVFLLLEELKDLKQVSDITGVQYCTVKHIASGTRHKWLQKEFPERYSILINRASYKVFGDSHYNAKYSNQQIVTAFNLLIEGNICTKEISTQTGVSIRALNHILAGTSHTWLSISYPDKYTTLMSRKIL